MDIQQIVMRGAPACLAAAAGVIDWQTRRIPNWLTAPGFLVGAALSTWLRGWPGLRDSLLGAGLGLLLLLPFVLIRSLGAGDWKLVGALGAFLGPQQLLAVLFVTILIAGIMAIVLVIWKGRTRQTLRNMGQMLAAFARMNLPGRELTLDSAESSKIPFGVAVAIAVVCYTAAQGWRFS